jgi:CMP-N,N'-diacetyllegionaminic acid synthase
MRALGLIPARGGSKGIPRKNIRAIAGKPLIAWTIEAALDSRMLEAVVVSTDDAEIAEVARASGADVPFLRPAALSTDTASGIDPVIHAIDTLPGFDAVLLLQPTSPLRTTADIDGILTLATDSGAPAIVSICDAEEHPFWMYQIGADARLRPFIHHAAIDRRQDLPDVFALNGALYFARCDWLREQGSFVGPETCGFVMATEHSIDIDTGLDWRIAEMLLGERQSNRRNV